LQVWKTIERKKMRPWHAVPVKNAMLLQKEPSTTPAIKAFGAHLKWASENGFETEQNKRTRLRNAHREKR
jgi:hypothetical protein